MTKFFEIQEVKNHELLIAEQTRLTDTRAKLSQILAESTEHAASKTAELNNTERDFIHGKATAQQVDLVRQDSDSASVKLVGAERMLKLADNAIQELDRKVSASSQVVANARYRFCQDKSAEIIARLNANVELKQLLAEAFAAQQFNGLRWHGGWSGFVDSVIFTQPYQKLIDAAIEQFSETHRLPKP